jgi:hypothetical protein
VHKDACICHMEWNHKDYGGHSVVSLRMASNKQKAVCAHVCLLLRVNVSAETCLLNCPITTAVHVTSRFVTICLLLCVWKLPSSGSFSGSTVLGLSKYATILHQSHGVDPENGDRMFSPIWLHSVMTQKATISVLLLCCWSVPLFKFFIIFWDQLGQSLFYPSS